METKLETKEQKCTSQSKHVKLKRTFGQKGKPTQKPHYLNNHKKSINFETKQRSI